MWGVSRELSTTPVSTDLVLGVSDLQAFDRDVGDLPSKYT